MEEDLAPFEEDAVEGGVERRRFKFFPIKIP